MRSDPIGELSAKKGQLAFRDLMKEVARLATPSESIDFSNDRLSQIAESVIAEEPVEAFDASETLTAVTSNEIVSSALHGFRKAAALDTLNVDEPQLSRFVDVLSSLLRDPGRQDAEHYSWLVSGASDLLREMTRCNTANWRTLAQQKQLVKLYEIIEPLASPESGLVEDDPLRFGTDWMSHVLNSDLGRLGTAICQLAVNTSEVKDRETSEPEEDWRELHSLCLRKVEAIVRRPEVRFDRAPIGLYLTYFYGREEKWFESNYDFLFPVNDPVAWEAIWAMHRYHQQRAFNLYGRLRHEYLKAVDIVAAASASEVEDSIPEWAPRVGVDIAIFWLEDFMHADDTVMERIKALGAGYTLSSVPDIISETLKKNPGEKYRARATSLVKSIQSMSASKHAANFHPYWNRLQILIPHWPASAWMGELYPSLLACLKSEDSHYYFNVMQFFDDAIPAASDNALNALELIVESARENYWLVPRDEFRLYLQSQAALYDGGVAARLNSLAALLPSR